MSDSEKPFACTTEGCNMSFVNEDHLTVHKKKHDMMLNLGINNKNNFFIADQTPTPTRFIRNCDEVGLFQDLQNDNPFEETFRRAVESGKGGVLTVPENVDNDDLHTPNVFPHITEECPSSVSNILKKNQENKIKDFIITPPTTQVVSNKVSCANDERNNLNANGTSLKENKTIETVTEISSDDGSTKKSDTQLRPMNAAEMQLVLTQDGKVLKFVAAPVLEQTGVVIQKVSKESKQLTIDSHDTNVIDLQTDQNKKLSDARLKLKQALIKNGAVEQKYNKNENKTTHLPKEKTKQNIDVTKKMAILERNRASSMRARAKRKAWITQLQECLKKSNETNEMLQNQVKILQGQVAKLKELLLAHKDCPVTKSMEENVVVGSKILTIKPNDMYIQPVKRPSNEKISIPKKKAAVSSNVNSNPVILPKISSAANTITLHGVETVPSLNIVTPFITSSDSNKTIFRFIPSNSKKESVVINTVIP